jgi:hypothetical protein
MQPPIKEDSFYVIFDVFALMGPAGIPVGLFGWLGAVWNTKKSDARTFLSGFEYIECFARHTPANDFLTENDGADGNWSQ